MFSSPFYNAFGLNISDLSIKVMQLKNNTGLFNTPSFEVNMYRKIGLPYGLIANGILQEPETVRRYIHHLLSGRKYQQKPIKGNWVVLSIPENQSFLKQILINKPAIQLIDEDILDLARKEIPFDEDSYFIDWQILPSYNGDSGISRVLVCATPKSIANSYTYLLESLGYGVIALEVEALSIVRCMINKKEKLEKEACAILDLGASRSSLIICDNNSVQFSVTTPYSGELLTTALSQKLKISYTEAESRKIKKGLDYKEHKGKAFEILKYQASKLSVSLEKIFDFYYSHFDNTNKIKSLILCGGGANLKKLNSVLSNRLKLDVTMGDPWKNLNNKKHITISKKESLSYVTATGLALRAADNPYFSRDLV